MNKPKSNEIIPLSDEDPMPFGKHKGVKLKEVPAGYLDWLSGQAFLYNWPRLEAYIEKSRKAIDQDLERKERER